MKRLVFLIVLVISYANSLKASDSGVVLDMSNGDKVIFTFLSSPQISFVDDELHISTLNGQVVSYAFGDVRKISFCESKETSIMSAMENGKKVKFDYRDNLIFISGLNLEERISLYTLNGNLVDIRNSDKQGNLNMNLMSIPSGVYILKTDSGLNFKFTK